MRAGWETAGGTFGSRPFFAEGWPMDTLPREAWVLAVDYLFAALN